MMSLSPDGRGEPEPGPLEMAWESSVRSGRDPTVVVDAAGPEGFGLRCFNGGGCCSLSAVVPAPANMVGASGMEPAPGGGGNSSSTTSGMYSRSCSGSDDGGNLSTC